MHDRELVWLETEHAWRFNCQIRDEGQGLVHSHRAQHGHAEVRLPNTKRKKPIAMYTVRESSTEVRLPNTKRKKQTRWRSSSWTWSDVFRAQQNRVNCV